MNVCIIHMVNISSVGSAFQPQDIKHSHLDLILFFLQIFYSKQKFYSSWLSHCLCRPQCLGSFLSSTYMLAGKSPPFNRDDTAVFRCITSGVGVTWQICGDRPESRHDRWHIRLDVRLQSRWQRGNERASSPWHLGCPTRRQCWSGLWEWLTVIIWPCQSGCFFLWGGTAMGSWLA